MRSSQCNPHNGKKLYQHYNEYKTSLYHRVSKRQTIFLASVIVPTRHVKCANKSHFKNPHIILQRSPILYTHHQPLTVSEAPNILYTYPEAATAVSERKALTKGAKTCYEIVPFIHRVCSLHSCACYRFTQYAKQRAASHKLRPRRF